MQSDHRNEDEPFRIRMNGRSLITSMSSVHSRKSDHKNERNAKTQEKGYVRFACNFTSTFLKRNRKFLFLNLQEDAIYKIHCHRAEDYNLVGKKMLENSEIAIDF